MKFYCSCMLILLTAAIAAAQIRSSGSAHLIASSKVAIADTEAGKIQGFIHHGIYTYRGVPYAKPNALCRL